MVQAEPVIYVRDGDLGILVDRVGVVGVVGVVGIVGIVRIVGVIGIVRVVGIIRIVRDVGVVGVVRNVGVVRLFRLLRQILRLFFRLFFRRFGDVFVLLRVDQDLRLRLRCVRVSGHCLRNDGGIGVCCIGFIPRLFLDAACGAKYDQ